MIFNSRKRSKASDQYTKDLNALKYLNNSNGNFENYVQNMDLETKKDFLQDLKYLINRVKSKYRIHLITHVISTALLVISFINLKVNFSGISAIIFILMFGIFFTVSIELFKQWRTVRRFKVLKKLVRKIWLASYENEDDDTEFFLF